MRCLGLIAGRHDLPVRVYLLFFFCVFKWVTLTKRNSKGLNSYILYDVVDQKS